MGSSSWWWLGCVLALAGACGGSDDDDGTSSGVGGKDGSTGGTGATGGSKNDSGLPDTSTGGTSASGGSGGFGGAAAAAGAGGAGGVAGAGAGGVAGAGAVAGAGGVAGTGAVAGAGGVAGTGAVAGAGPDAGPSDAGPDTSVGDGAVDASDGGVPGCTPPIVLDLWTGADAGTPAEWPKVTAAASGAALASWEEKLTSALSHITASTYSPSTSTWSTPTVIADGAQPRTALGSTGDAIAMWRVPVSGNVQKWRRIYRPATGWNTAVMLANTGGGDPSVVAFGPNGDGYMLWEASISGKNRLRARRFVSATGLETSDVSLDDGSVNVFYPALGISPNDVSYAFWTVSGGTLHVARHESGTWTLPETSTAPATSSIGFIRVAVDSSNSATVLTRAVSNGGAYFQVQSVSWASGTGFSWGPRVDLAGPTSNLGDAEIVVDASGNATAVYDIRVSTSSNESKILARRRVAGVWGPEIELNPGAKLSDADVSRSVSMDAAGNIYVTYDIFANQNHDIGLRKYDAANDTWQPERIVQQSPPNSYRPVVGASVIGGHVVFERRIGTSAETDICASLCPP